MLELAALVRAIFSVLANLVRWRRLDFPLWLFRHKVLLFKIDTHLGIVVDARSLLFALWMLKLTVLFHAIYSLIAQFWLLFHFFYFIVMSELTDFVLLAKFV